jgi:multimeric flavodoxin WrbA
MALQQPEGHIMQKILILEGSPRENGNSSLLARQVAAGAKEHGAEVESLYLHGMDIRPCSACDACQESLATDCIIEDELQAIYPLLRSADALVFASPIYWFTVSAQIKLLIDRCYALTWYEPGSPHAEEEPSYTIRTDLTGKKIGVILTYGDTDPFSSGAVNALRTFQDMFRFVGADVVDMIYGSAMAPGEVANNHVLIKQAFALGKKLAEND